MSITVRSSAALAHEVLQVRDAGPAEARAACRRSDPRSRGSASPAVFFHGSALPHIGMPLTIAFGPRPTGGKTMTSNFALRLSSVRDLLRADVGVRHLRDVERLAPPAFGLRASARCGGARRAARAPDASSPTARRRSPTICRPRSAAAFCRSAAATFLMMNEPRLNFLPAASNGSSAASNDASLNW